MAKMKKDKIVDVVPSPSTYKTIILKDKLGVFNGALGETTTYFTYEKPEVKYHAAPKSVGKTVCGTLEFLAGEGDIVNTTAAVMKAVADSIPDELIEDVITCGTSKAGDAVGWHGGTGVTEDKYGHTNGITVGGLEVVQLRALGDSIRLRLANDLAPQPTVTITVNDTEITLDREDGQPRYNVVDATVAAMFVDGSAIIIEEVKDAPVEKAGSTKKSKASRKTKK